MNRPQNDDGVVALMRSRGYIRSARRHVLRCAGGALLALLGVGQAGAASLPVDVPVVVPFRLQDNLVRIDAYVDGVHLDAVLDSGSGTLVVDRGVARALHLRAHGATGLALGGGAGQQAFTPVSLPRLRIGGHTWRDVDGASMDLTGLSASAGFPIQALLGAPVFARRALIVDYGRQRVTVLAPGQALACAAPVPLQLRYGVPVVSARLRADPAGHEAMVRLIVDLGTRHHAVMLGGRFLHSATGRRLAARGVRAVLGTGIGGRVHGREARAARLTVGTHVFIEPMVALTGEVDVFSRGLADGTLGVPIWAGRRIGFDYPHHRLCLFAAGEQAHDAGPVVRP